VWSRKCGENADGTINAFVRSSKSRWVNPIADEFYNITFPLWLKRHPYDGIKPQPADDLRAKPRFRIHCGFIK